MSLQKWAQRVTKKFKDDPSTFTETRVLRTDDVVALVTAAREVGLAQRPAGAMLLRLGQVALPWPDSKEVWRRAVNLKLGQEWEFTKARQRTVTAVPLASSSSSSSSSSSETKGTKRPREDPDAPAEAKRAKRHSTAITSSDSELARLRLAEVQQGKRNHTRGRGARG
jgi:hypothetical protein